MPAIDPLVCPNGHHSVTVGRDRIHCEVCGRGYDKSELRNLKEENLHGRA